MGDSDRRPGSIYTAWPGRTAIRWCFRQYLARPYLWSHSDSLDRERTGVLQCCLPPDRRANTFIHRSHEIGAFMYEPILRGQTTEVSSRCCIDISRSSSNAANVVRRWEPVRPAVFLRCCIFCDAAFCRPTAERTAARSVSPAELAGQHARRTWKRFSHRGAQADHDAHARALL